MLPQARVLIVEDELLIAMDLAWTVQDAGGHVVGPVASVKEALGLAKNERLDGAILDVSLSDGEVTPVAEALAERRIPVVMHTASEVPASVRDRFPGLAIFEKPTEPLKLARQLAKTIVERRLEPAGVSV